MNRLVYSCFKAIMLSMILVFVLDMSFYMFRVMNLNQRMLLLMSSMVKTVEQNNYLPEGDKDTYKGLMISIANQMNTGDTFIKGFNWNYSTANSGIDSLTGVPADKFRATMSTPANYGDIMVVFVEVGVYAPTWGYDYEQVNGDNQVRLNKKEGKLLDLSYRYVVPCLHYVKQGSNP